MNTLSPTLGLPDLINLIKTSLMGEAQKNALMAALPQTTDADRAQIINLIQASNAEAAQIEESYQKNISGINKQYKIKLDVLVKEEKKRAYETFEKLEDEDKVRAMMDIEHEIQTVKTSPNMGTTPTLRKKHSGAGFMIKTILILGLLGTGAWYALKALS